VKNKDNVGILEQETNREDFTQHGLHLNATGKDKVVKLMAQNITQLFEVTKKLPIILKWRTTHSDPDLVNRANYATNEDHEVLDNKERNEDQLDSINQGIRTSSRPKRIPNTRSDDFFWV
jgi:hypothetical protein